MTGLLTPLVIVGAGGHGRETLDVVEAINEQNHVWHFLGFIDDGPVVQDRLDRRDATLVHRDELDPSVGPLRRRDRRPDDPCAPRRRDGPRPGSPPRP